MGHSISAAGSHRTCAYCGRAEKLTREDVFATFLQKSHPSYRTYLDHRRRKLLHGAAPVVRDVCKYCNNVALSKLDGYAAELNRLYFSRLPVGPMPIVFRYDYYQLLRWLLKAWYNDARASNRNVHTYRAFVPYILGSVAEPPQPVTLMLGILSPFDDGSKPKRREYPRVIRFGTTSLPDPQQQADLVLGRMLSLNSYLFHLFVWRPELAQHALSEYAHGFEQRWRFKELQHTLQEVTLGYCAVNTLRYLLATQQSGGLLMDR